jgi:hypothetical protein
MRSNRRYSRIEEEVSLPCCRTLKAPFLAVGCGFATGAPLPAPLAQNGSSIVNIITIS